MYQEVYRIGKKISKRDRFGLHATIEHALLQILGLAIEASLKPRAEKLNSLRPLRRQIEVAKHLIRAESELNIISGANYLQLQKRLQEISKMAAGWEKYAT